MSPPDRSYPEHEKLRAVADQAQTIDGFVEWLESEKDIHLAVRRGDVLDFVSTPVPQLMVEFFGIDADALKAETRTMLAVLREAAADG